MDKIRQNADNLFKDLSAYLLQGEELEKKFTTLDIRERELRELEKAIAEKRIIFQREKDALKEEKEFITKSNLEIKAKELKLNQEKGQLVSIQAEEFKLEQKKKEVQVEIDKLEEKRKEIAQFDDKVKELEKREAMLAKEVAIDRKRKEILDLREARIKQRETQLQIQSEI